MTDAKRKALKAAEDEFEKTAHGSPEEQAALIKWRALCETEQEDFVAVSAYQRRQQAAKAAKKNARRSHRS